MKKYFTGLLILLLVGCATRFSEDDLQTSGLMPEPVALSILSKYKIPQSFSWNSPSLFCSSEWINVRETQTVRFSASEGKLYLMARPGFCIYHAYVPNVYSAADAKEIALALRALGAKINSYYIPQPK